MFECICNHLKYGFNKGNIRSAITIFRQKAGEGHDFRVWNSQFISYAGYKIDDNTVVGDKNQIEFILTAVIGNSFLNNLCLIWEKVIFNVHS